MEIKTDIDRLAMLSEDTVLVLGYPYDAPIPEQFSVERVAVFDLEEQVVSWRYLEVFSGDERVAECVVVPQISDKAPPTAALGCLLRACSTNDEAMVLTDAGWRAAPGKVVVVCDRESSQELDSALLDAPKRIVALGSVEPHLLTGFEVSEALEGTIHGKKAARILLDALFVSTKKYRFLEIYRSLERLFLLHILKELTDGFFLSPGEALSKAVKAIGNEREALDNLIRQAAVVDRADAIRVEIEKLENNRFAAALKRKFDKEGPEVRGSANKGSAYIYYIRCAIVHAGSKDLIFEEYEDAEDVLDAIMVTFERLTLSACGFAALETSPPPGI